MSLLGQCEWNFSFKKADWSHFTYFIEQLCLQLKIFPSFSLWDDGAWTLRECRYLWGGGGGGGAHCGAGCLSHCYLTPFLVYFCCCILAAILLIQSGLVCLFLDVFKGNFPLDCRCILNLSSTLRSIVPCCAWMSEINLETLWKPNALFDLIWRAACQMNKHSPTIHNSKLKLLISLRFKILKVLSLKSLTFLQPFYLNFMIVFTVSDTLSFGE